MILVLKMTQKYRHNMVLISRYKEQLHGGKKGQKIVFFLGGVPLQGLLLSLHVFQY